MDNLLYESCLRYFTSLANFGYRNEEDVKKLLFYVYIQELVDSSVSISEEDYNHIEGALYKLYGSTCLMPYPDYCESMNNHLSDIAELKARVSRIEASDTAQNTRLNTIESTQVVKVKPDSVTINDIII